MRRRAQQAKRCFAEHYAVVAAPFLVSHRARFQLKLITEKIHNWYDRDRRFPGLKKFHWREKKNAWRPWVIGLERRPITFRSATTEQKRPPKKHAKWLWENMWRLPRGFPLLKVLVVLRRRRRNLRMFLVALQKTRKLGHRRHSLCVARKNIFCF